MCLRKTKNVCLFSCIWGEQKASHLNKSFKTYKYKWLYELYLLVWIHDNSFMSRKHTIHQALICGMHSLRTCILCVWEKPWLLSLRRAEQVRDILYLSLPHSPWFPLYYPWSVRELLPPKGNLESLMEVEGTGGNWRELEGTGRNWKELTGIDGNWRECSPRILGHESSQYLPKTNSRGGLEYASILQTDMKLQTVLRNV